MNACKGSTRNVSFGGGAFYVSVRIYLLLSNSLLVYIYRLTQFLYFVVGFFFLLYVLSKVALPRKHHLASIAALKIMLIITDI